MLFNNVQQIGHFKRSTEQKFLFKLADRVPLESQKGLYVECSKVFLVGDYYIPVQDFCFNVLFPFSDIIFSLQVTKACKHI